MSFLDNNNDELDDIVEYKRQQRFGNAHRNLDGYMDNSRFDSSNDSNRFGNTNSKKTSSGNSNESQTYQRDDQSKMKRRSILVVLGTMVPLLITLVVFSLDLLEFREEAVTEDVNTQLLETIESNNTANWLEVDYEIVSMFADNEHLEIESANALFDELAFIYLEFKTTSIIRNYAVICEANSTYRVSWENLVQELLEISNKMNDEMGISNNIYINEPNNPGYMILYIRNGIIEYNFLDDEVNSICLR